MAAVDVASFSDDVKIIKEEGFYANYTPGRTLGYGVTSVVRKCINHSSNKEYAVKIIEKTPLKEQEVRAEIFALSLLADDPNIIGLVDVYENDNHFFLVFELAEGGELFDFLNKMITIPEKKACRMMYEILKVVSHMHAFNLVHRDLKPENILLTSDQHLLVSDFGFAVQLKHNERLRDLCGTPDYLAPEVLKCSIEDDHPGYGLEVDLWACGVIAYLLLAGFSPFWHRKQNVMLWNIIDGKYTLEGPEWKHISENSKDLISKLLVVNPDARITANVAITHPWFELLRTHSTLYYKPKISFKLLVKTIITMKSLYDLSVKRVEKMTVEMIIKNPYFQTNIRKIIDTAAFTIYGHWIKRSNIQYQNRAAIFENKPKTDLCDEERCLLTKPFQYKFSYTNPELQRKV